MIFINYKTYDQGLGENALRLTQILEEVAHESQVKIIPVVNALDAEKIVSSTQLEVWLQHADGYLYGAHTGFIIPEHLSKIGITGVFLNHSEHKFSNFDDLYKVTESAMNANLKTLIFADNIEELKKVCDLAPTYVSYEPSDLVGSTTLSVSEAKPEIIKEAADIARGFGLPLVVGAGIHTQADIRKGLELGAVGFAVATDIVKASDPKKELLDLIEGYK